MSPGAAALVLGLAYAVLLVGRARAARAEADRQERRDRARAALPDGWRADVAVLQPILSGDPALGTVLAGNLAALPDARFVWLVDDDDPVAADVAARLAAACPGHPGPPGHRIRILSCPAAPDGVNPKAFKLEIGWRACRETVLLVLDDDARLSGASLATLVAALDDGALACALPHHAPADGGPSTDGSSSKDGSPPTGGFPPTGGLPSALLDAFVDDNAAMTYLAPLRLVDPVSINGMAYVIRRATLERLSGFAPIRHHLADDLGMATMLRAANLTLVQTAAPVEVRTTLAGWNAYVRQMHRWYLFATLLLSARPARVRLLAVVLQAVHPLLLWTLVGLAVAAPSVGTIGTLGLVAALRSAVLRAVRVRFAAGGRARPLVSLVAELLQPVHLAHAALVRTIRWRTRTYRVRALDDFSPR